MRIVWFLIGVLVGILIGIWSVSGAIAAEFGLALQEDVQIFELQPGECAVSIMDKTKVTLATDKTRATIEIGIHDHERNPVEGARIYVEWSTRGGKMNYCTTNENGKCTLGNTSPGGRNWKPLWIKIRKVEHPEMTYRENEKSTAVWLICPADLDCD
jgi:hypothetical protein